MKIQKHLADCGVASRREIERMIVAGRIKVNGVPAHVGQHIQGHERIEIDNRVLSRKPVEPEATQVLLYHKPEGKVCTRSDEKGRTTVFDDLPPIKPGRWIMIGRLDINTSGLLLFTNNGELAHRLMHPSSNIEREYAVRIFGDVNEAMLDRLLKGVMLEDGLSHFTSIIPQEGEGKNRWYHVTLSRGRYREVRRLWESQGVIVSRLIRIRYGECILPPGLRQGHYVLFTPDEIQKLQKM